MVALLDSYCNLYMAQTADNLARKYDITREEQDEFALRSQMRAARRRSGQLREEIVPVTVGQGRDCSTEDDHPRPETTMEGWPKLKPAFAKDGFVTAGNASGIVDGAAMVVVTTADKAESDGQDAAGPHRLLGHRRLRPARSWASAPSRPRSSRWRRPGMKLDDIDLIEINEAFAARSSRSSKELGIDTEKLNVNGGAIALGHPLGARRHAPGADAALRAAPPQEALRPGVRMHRRRAGDRHDRGAELDAPIPSQNQWTFFPFWRSALWGSSCHAASRDDGSG